MSTETSWIARGQLVAEPTLSGANSRDEELLLHRSGMVRITSADDHTEIKWSVFAPNWASLYYVMQWIDTYPAPFKLTYFLAGWFEERFPDAWSARERIDTIMGKSDIHITARTIVKEVDPVGRELPQLLRRALQTEGTGLTEFSVECAFDPLVGRYAVTRVGPRSSIAQLWGVSPVSYPCQIGHSYDQMVSQAYNKVLKYGAPHHDHVLAAMKVNDSLTKWISYQRVVLPHEFRDGRRGVSVVSQLTDVDIRLL